MIAFSDFDVYLMFVSASGCEKLRIITKQKARTGRTILSTIIMYNGACIIFTDAVILGQHNRRNELIFIYYFVIYEEG